MTSRRAFLLNSARGLTGLVVGFHWPVTQAGRDTANDAQATATGLAPNAFVHISPDDVVTVTVKHIEFGQGTFTGLPTVLAEELDADFASVRVRGAPADPARYNNLNWGGYQGTGGSSSMHNSWPQLRRAGATARALLVQAAALAWQVRPGEIEVSRGVLTHASGRRATFGEFAHAAGRLPVPKNVALKEADSFSLIGSDVPRTDIRAKVTGSAVYTQDFTLPGMLTALVRHPPRFGATVADFDAAPALAVPGVVRVIPLPSGVAVVARDFHAASKGRAALRVTFNEQHAVRISSADQLSEYRELASRPGHVARNDGNVETALQSASAVHEAFYEVPYLAHATMEPMNCVARVSGKGSGRRCEMWYGVQTQSLDLRHVGQALDLPPERIALNMLYAGGSFGRRASSTSDYVVEAARIAAGLDDGVAVKLVWTREDDMRAGAYRPLNVHRVRGALDERGTITAWDQTIVGQSILAGTPFGASTDKIDETTIEGAVDLPYPIANFRVSAHEPDVGVPVLWWRSVGHSHTAFSTECFFDELATTAGRDPVAMRLDSLSADPRRRAVVARAADMAGWSKPLPPREGFRRGRGIAVHYCFRTWVAEVAEVSVDSAGGVVVDHVYAAVDCGIAVNPDVVRAQVEGGIAYALSALLGEAITLSDGVVEQGNFDRYEVLRLAQMPRVTVDIMPSTEAPTGIGEPAVPPLAPAVCNAVFAATGKRIRSLPLNRTG